MNETDSGTRPTEPIFASSLIDDADLDRVLEQVFAGDETKVAVTGRHDRLTVATGVKSLDDALHGGLTRQSVVAVSGDAGAAAAAASELCLAYLSTSLLVDQTSTAAIIDATGNLDVLRLYALVLARLRNDAGLRHANGCDGLGVEEVAATVLDRVKIMRVFDFMGVVEAVGELRDELEGKGFVAVERGDGGAGMGEPDISRAEEPKEIPESTIADSEDEGEDEMLFDAPEGTDLGEPAVGTRLAIPLSRSETAADVSPRNHAPEVKENAKDSVEKEARTSFILIDNLAHVVSPLLKKDYIQANTLTTALLRSLSHLTHTHSLLTLLLNPASLPRHPTNQLQQQPIPPPSLFASNQVIPALGHLLPRYLDVHLLVSRLPRRKADARALANHAEPPGTLSIGLKRRGVETVGVVEVLADRWMGLVGSWGTFAESDEGLRDV